MVSKTYRHSEANGATAPGLETPCAHLIQFTDPHLLEDPQAEHRSVNTSTSFERVLCSASAIIEHADAVLLTGDIAQDEAAATYARLRRSWTHDWVGTETPVWCIPGNHDAPVLMAAELAEAPFSCLGHHSLGDSWEVILLDSREPGRAAGYLGTEELARLASRLEHSKAQHLLLVLHHQPITLGRSWLDSVGLQDRDQLLEQVHRDGRVRGVLFGHIHHAIDRTENGIRFMGSPSTGAQFTPHQTEFGVDRRPPGFRTLALYPDGAIKTDVIWLGQSDAHPACSARDNQTA